MPLLMSLAVGGQQRLAVDATHCVVWSWGVHPPKWRPHWAVEWRGLQHTHADQYMSRHHISEAMVHDAAKGLTIGVRMQGLSQCILLWTHTEPGFRQAGKTCFTFAGDIRAADGMDVCRHV